MQGEKNVSLNCFHKRNSKRNQTAEKYSECILLMFDWNEYLNKVKVEKDVSHLSIQDMIR